MSRRGRTVRIAVATAVAGGVLALVPAPVQGDNTVDSTDSGDLSAFVGHAVAGEFGTSDALPPPGIVEQIVGGTDAKMGEFPWASFLIIETNQGLASCGGSLIAKRWILTAAHCVDGAISVGAAVGKTNRPTSLNSPRWKFAATVFIHSGYNPNSFGRNDVALVKLRKSINQQTLPIAKPAESDLRKAGRVVTVAGWGIMNKNANSIPIDLQKASIPVVGQSKCSNLFSPPFQKGQNLCAGFNPSQAGSAHGACQGDSGSALIAYSKNGPVQIGIVSYGIGRCTSLKFPGVYMRADTYRMDIVNRIGSLPAPPKVPKCNGKKATITGTVGNDILVGTPQRDIIVSLAGNDWVRGLGANDLICLGSGADTGSGEQGDDVIFGGPGPDDIDGNTGADRLLGEGAADLLNGKDGPDRLDGGDGNDVINGGAGGDTVKGGTGDDTLSGGAGPDTLGGNTGDDDISGGSGNDDLDGGLHTDICRGNAGIDTGINCETMINIP